MIAPPASLSLEWDMSSQWDRSDGRLVVKGKREAVLSAMKLPALVDIGRRFFVFRAETCATWTESGDGDVTARYAGTWAERPA